MITVYKTVTVFAETVMVVNAVIVLFAAGHSEINVKDTSYRLCFDFSLQDTNKMRSSD